MALDPTSIGSLIATGALGTFVLWRDYLKPKREKSADSNRPAHSLLAERVVKLEGQVESLSGRMSEFITALPHLASADEVATYMNTTTKTLMEMKEGLGRLRGALDASRSRGGD